MKIASFRNTIIETLHDVSYAVAKDGRIIQSHGDIQALTSVRSSIKPFTVMPLVSEELIKKYELSESIITLMASSHSGEPKQRQLIASYLKKHGLSPDMVHTYTPILDERQSREFIQEGEKDRSLYNNCSAKHLGFLLMCKEFGFSCDNYWEEGHELNQFLYQFLLDNLSFFGDKRLEMGTDNCSVPCFFLPLCDLALSYQRMQDISPLLYNAIVNEPYYIAGSDRFESKLSSLLRVVVKNGAEGVMCLSDASNNIGIALKVHSGNYLASQIAMASILLKLGYYPNQNEQLLKLSIIENYSFDKKTGEMREI